jgi:putative membrane protein
LGLFYILLAVPQAAFFAALVGLFSRRFELRSHMTGLLLHWLVSAVSLAIAAYLVPGIEIRGLGPALIAPVVIGLVNATIGFFLKVITFPLTVLTLGLFWVIINALMLQLAAFLVPGFFVAGFGSALLGAILLSLLNMILRGFVL